MRVWVLGRLAARHARRPAATLQDAQARCCQLFLLPACPLPPQALRLALLDWMTHAVVAHGALVQTCLQTLAYSLLPPPGPPLPDPNPGEPWQPAPAQAAIQDEVLAAAEKVGGGGADMLFGTRAWAGRAERVGGPAGTVGFKQLRAGCVSRPPGFVKVTGSEAWLCDAPAAAPAEGAAGGMRNRPGCTDSLAGTKACRLFACP